MVLLLVWTYNPVEAGAFMIHEHVRATYAIFRTYHSYTVDLHRNTTGWSSSPAVAASRPA